MRLIQEERGLTAATHVYEPDSYVPLARIDLSPDLGAKARTPDEPALAARVYYLHTNINGAPEEMTDARGALIWQARYAVWGNTVVEHWHREHRPDPSGLSAQSPLPQNLRMQGQYADQETGLCYNTFRYYDPDIGRFISQDPIGLAGGMNLYQYAPNPISWIDPWGWAAGEYPVVGEARLPTEMYHGTDYRHFQESNRQLYYQMKADPSLKASIESKYPGTFDHVSPGKRGSFSGKAPKDLTWHHHGQVGGLLQLVDSADHNARHKDYHPTGKGGRNKWGGGTLCR